MNDNAKLWVKALRSGKYKQSSESVLKGNDGGYCCLGVACALFEKENGVDLTKRNGYYETDDEVEALTGGEFSKVREWLGLRTGYGTYSRYGCDLYTSSLAEMNDQGGSFEEIADFIEERATDLFEQTAEDK